MGSSASTVNRHLTNYARGVAQDRKSAIAEFLCPTVVTGVAGGQYKSYSDKNAFQIYETARAIGGRGERVQFAATDPYFNCSPQSLEIAIDDAEREKAGENDAQLEEAKILTLVSSAINSHEKKVVDKVRAAVAAVAGKGVWSNAANDPIKEINDQIVAIATDCGRMPNRLLFSLPGWSIVRDHPKVLARFPGAASVGVTYQQFASLLLNPAIQIEVGVLSADSAKMGAAANKANIVGSDVFIFFNENSPSLYDPSFAKTFMPTAGGVESVKQFREEPHNDIYHVSWSEDIQVVSTLMVRRITLS